MKWLQFPSGFPKATDGFKIMCKTQVRGHYGRQFPAHVGSVHVCLAPLNGPLSLIELKFEFQYMLFKAHVTFLDCPGMFCLVFLAISLVFFVFKTVG